MNPRARTLTTAWLGLIAMCLIVLAPLVSQLVMAHRALQPESALCSASLSGGEVKQSSHTVSLSACGYCDLLASHTAMPPIAAVTLPLLAIAVLVFLPSLNTSFTPLGAFPYGRPRAPTLPR